MNMLPITMNEIAVQCPDDPFRSSRVTCSRHFALGLHERLLFPLRGRVLEGMLLLEAKAEEEHGDAGYAKDAGKHSCGDEDVARSGVGSCVFGEQVYLMI